MNENLNLVEILKDCPMGTKLYSPAYGDVELVAVRDEATEYPIVIKLSKDSGTSLTIDGRISVDYSGECMLFPSNEQRDWGKFKVKKERFNPKTLKPFDIVLMRDNDNDDDCWGISYFSHIMEDGKFYTLSTYLVYAYKYCIPYNDDTKHLVGTTDNAPEYYRFWED